MGDKYVPNEREIAFHEAGHTVTGYLFYKVRSVSILPTELEGRNTHGLTDIVMPDEMFLGGADKEEKFVEYCKIIICLLSGKYFQKTVLGFDDMAGAIDDIEYLSLYLYDNNDNFYEPLWSAATAIAAEFCSDAVIISMVNIIADDLLQKKVLNEKEIKGLLNAVSIDFVTLLAKIKETHYLPFCDAMTLLLKNSKN